MLAKNDRDNKNIKVIITGATGMVGEGVLHECLSHLDVEQVLIINRKPSGVTHPKLTEIVLADLFDIASIEPQLKGYDACFYCLGVSSVRMNEAEYSRITYDLTLHIAGLLVRTNPEMVFCYVTAGGTDRTEQGRSMWARVKGKTENHLLQLPFKGAYMFRPGYIHPTKGLKNAHRFYAAFTWLYPVLRLVLPRHVITLSELGRAMIHIVNRGYESSILESRDMAKAAQN
ncbi:NAD-dependent epimerase/dehydratase family protein [Paenibacillus sp. PL91]|uniref:NAD-dependent epimerase/dehydratase family protein n=1 Tax=Paenibacillus sp. PL91 TaxID=2729538 RepID=UPI00145E1D75|nr:NAD-dependent epimerase/dehydratase family protein [Paenibacillus sp. PL91]MBC9203816.1 NAD-dependent epimerase/dehydratase family protein [Paenibacillus sp. PL91]